jgi:osmotically-inducible protein OsmY
MTKKKSAKREDKRRESGEPGGGQGRRDEVGGSGVYPASAENIPGDAVIRTPQQWGQGERGAEGYEDSGGSELVWREGQLIGGLTSDASGRPTIDIHGGDRPEQPAGKHADEAKGGAVAQERSDQRSGKDRRGPSRTGPAVSRRMIKRDEDTSQLLERGEGPTAEEQVDPSVDSPSEVTNDGGPGADASDRFGGPLSVPGEPDSHGMRGTGGEGGYSTLGGGVYPDEGSEDDAPSYGDWQRHSSGATSGARGQEGLGFPGEGTWGEEQYTAERREEQGRRGADGGSRARRRPDESLAQEIREILTKDPELEVTEMAVEVEGGAVTISGVVDDSDARLLAEELVESLSGVREVHNRLRVERQDG